MTPEEIRQLVDSLLDGDISEADFVCLEAELQVNPGAREQYYERLKLDTLLSDQAAGSTGAETASFTPLRWRPSAAAAVLIAALVSGAVFGWSFGKRPQNLVETPAQPTGAEPVASGFGVVADSADAVWEQGRQFGRGDLLSGGELQLESGIVKIDLFSGVTVIVEGHAHFELLSPMEMKVNRGKVRALVPEHASGFKIDTGAGEIVDLGTEFSVEVESGHADVHVIDGEIEWHPRSAAMRRLKEGDALRWAQDGGGTPLDLEARTVADLEQALTAHRQKRREAWLQQAEQLKGDPSLIAYFPMHRSGPGHRRLSDHASGAHHATIVQARRVTDRWGHADSALDFSPTGSRARLDIQGTHRSLTFLCWTKIDSLDRRFNSLFLTDGHELSEPHWQILQDGRLFFAVKKREWESDSRPDKHIFYSPPIWDPSKSGRWMQIATIYDVESRSVTHYVDGKTISSEDIPPEYLVEDVVIGAASIGNWNEPKYARNPNFAIRNLNGSIDEFAIYNRALSPEQITALYEIGKP